MKAILDGKSLLGRFLFLSVLLVAGSASAQKAIDGQSVRSLLAAGRADEVVQLIQPKAAQALADAESYNLLCRAYFMVEEWDHGIPACERAREIDPQKASYSLWLGRIYGEKADHVGFISAAGLAKKVRESFERAVELEPKSWEARTDLAEFYLEAPGIVGGGKDKAHQQADAIMVLNPPMAHWVEARIAEKDGDTAAAEREYRAEIASSHSGTRGWLDLAAFQRRTHHFEEMEESLRSLEAGTVDRRESLMDAGSLLWHAGRDFPMALRFLRRYLEAPVEEGPAFKAHDLLGRILEKQGDVQGAAGEYRKALALAANYAKAKEDLRRVER
ncbi:MAG TPA: hypothetical protein VKV39_04240 [Candidatus Sulfotelmatobacter sp.]|nr:hypothetical protein [Candidatus Sulfotelmatobacter sp.]